MKLEFRPKKVLAALAVAASALAAGGAHADALTVLGAAFDSNGVPYVGSYATTSTPQQSGVMALWDVRNETTNASFLALCLEPFQTLMPNMQYISKVDYSSGAYGGQNAALVQELFDRYYQPIASRTASTDYLLGFQLALWGLAANQPVAGWSLPGNPAKNQALDMLTQVSATGSVAQVYTLTEWKNAQYQDVLAAAPVAAVPEPESYALILAGLAMLAAVHRRTRKVS